MERSASGNVIRGHQAPDFAALHPGCETIRPHHLRTWRREIPPL